MPLDVALVSPDGKQEHRLQFRDDAYFWFLYPWLSKVRESTGKYVDLYGDAEFHEANGLLPLIHAMSEAMASARTQPRTWQVHTGTQLRPERKELYQQVERERLVESIVEFQATLAEARAKGLTVVFRGD
jgi:hypothetical protein